MKKLLVTSLSLLFVASLVVGCNRRPDPRDNPNFNEAAGANPGAVKMEPLKSTKAPGT